MNPTDPLGFVDRAYLVFLFPANHYQRITSVEVELLSPPVGSLSRTLHSGLRAWGSPLPHSKTTGREMLRASELPMEVQTAARLARKGLCPLKGRSPVHFGAARTPRTFYPYPRMSRAGHMPTPSPPNRQVQRSVAT